MLQMIFIFIGLSLDSFIVMMQKGAQLANVSFGKKLLYSLIFAFINSAMLLAGYGLSLTFIGFVPDGKLEITIACLIIVVLGVWLMTKSYKNGDFEERLDPDFDYKKLVKLAVYTSIDTLFVGAGFSLLGFDIPTAVMASMIISFITVFVALEIGYNLGANYQRVVGMVGGALMIFFSMYLMSIMVLKFII